MYSLPSNLSPRTVELAFITVASWASVVGWLTRPVGDEVICLTNTVMNELKKTGLKDPLVLEELVKEFLELSAAMPAAPLDNILWNITIPLYQIRYYLCERRALKIVMKKAYEIARAEESCCLTNESE